MKRYSPITFKSIKRTTPILISIALILLLSNNLSLAQAGITWTSRTSAADNSWTSVTYGNGLFVAVASSGTGNRVMTSPDGITWTSRTSAADNSWTSVTYGNGLFVAVASSGTGNRVMTSPDGITWTSRTSAADNSWNCVTYGNGLFVAGGTTATPLIMTSPDGITWTARTAAKSVWKSVIYANAIFVAVGSAGLNRIITSGDGITWTVRSAAAVNTWSSVTYGNSVFVATSNSGTSNRVMTSSDGITWTSQTSAADNNWTCVTYGNNLFVAVSSDGTNRIMTSSDGITWTSRTAAAANSWSSLCYGNGAFVAVASSGTGNRVMTSGTSGTLPVQWISFTAKQLGSKHELRWQTANETNNLKFEIERSSNGFSFEKIGEVVGSANSNVNTEYTFTNNTPPTGISYYRLKQVDIDGRFEYSKIAQVNNKLTLSFSLSPNPVYDRLIVRELSKTNKPYSYSIINLAGQVLLTGILPANNTIYIKSLSKGWYQLTVNGNIKKFVKL